MGDSAKYSDKDILVIIDHPCYCHPYCGSTCDKCLTMSLLFEHQVDDLKRLEKEGKLKRNTDHPGMHNFFEVVRESSPS